MLRWRQETFVDEAKRFLEGFDSLSELLKEYEVAYAAEVKAQGKSSEGALDGVNSRVDAAKKRVEDKKGEVKAKEAEAKAKNEEAKAKGQTVKDAIKAVKDKQKEIKDKQKAARDKQSKIRDNKSKVLKAKKKKDTALVSASQPARSHVHASLPSRDALTQLR